MYKACISLKIISKHFILYDAIMNGIVSLISFVNSSLRAYGNAFHFHILILCPAPLLNSFISSNRVFWCVCVFLRVYVGTIMVPAK